MLKQLHAALFALLFALAAFAGPACAAEDDPGSSFLTPFPESDVYQVTIIGDTFAEGLLAGLIEAFGTDARLNIQKKHRAVDGVMSSEFEAKMRDLDEAVARDPMNIAIIMVGEDDRVPLKSSSGRKVAVGTPEWKTEYTRRIDRLMKAVKRKNASVYWVGLPNFSHSDANEQAQTMNDVIRERAYLNSFKYIDAFAGFSDETGGYSAYGPDLAGKIRVLREGDGVHFTDAGNRKLAHFVEKELRRDLTQAKNERAIPLLGSEAEQAKVNPGVTPAPGAAPKQSAPATTAAPAGATPAAGQADAGVKIVRSEGASGAPPGADASGDQKADNGKITLKAAGANGREEATNVEIARPAIPASVVALMARREGSAQMGDMIVDQISGGLTLMSSITPAGNKGRGKLSPAQAPYFRLLVKGERLNPKPGRADDTSLPLNAEAAPQSPLAPAPVAPAAPAVAPKPAAAGKS